MRSGSRNPSLTIDAGSLLFEKGSLNDNEALQEKITAEGITVSYNLMDYDAVGIGPNDLAAGLDYLVDIKKHSNFSWLSANIISQKDNHPLFTPYLLRTLGDLKCAIIGITGRDVSPFLEQEKGTALKPWQEILPPLLAELSAKSDFVILLSSLSSQEDLEIARKFETIHLIIEANGGSGNKEPVLINNTLITHSTKQGKYLGFLQVDWQPAGLWQKEDPRPILAQKQAALDRLEWQLRRMEGRGNPEKIFKHEPEKLSTYHRIRADRQSIAKEVRRLNEQLQATDGKKKLSYYSFSFIAMETTLPDDQKVSAKLAEIKEKISKLTAGKAALAKKERQAADGTDPMQMGYVGWKRCIGCHSEIGAKWQQTPHARSYDTLVGKSQQFNQDCLPCHVTGIISGEEPYILTLPEELLQVGCEACHGPGKIHAAESATALRRPGQAVCLRCHTPDQDDNFDFSKKTPLIH